MSEQIEITDREGQTRVVPVVGDIMLLGSGADADVCVPESSLDAHHLRFVRSGERVRVEPVRPGAIVTVNGEDLFCKDLEPGDTIEVDGLRLRWRAPKAPAPPPPGRIAGRPVSRAVAPPTARPTAQPAGRAVPHKFQSAVGAREHAGGATKVKSQRPSRSRGMPGWVPISGIFFAVVIVAAIVLRSFADSTWPSSPQNYVDLAREQLGNHQPQRALDTLAFALREATGATREQALALETDIRRMLLELGEMPKVVQARQEHDVLQSFVASYLQDDVQRAEARELVRLCDGWLGRYRELCARHSDGQRLLAAVEQQRSRYVALAALGEPDTAADVSFAARSRLRFAWRDYRGAMQILDAFLRVEPGSEPVHRERDAMIRDGEQWLRGKLRILDSLLARGDRDNAAKDLAQLDRWSVLPEWEGLMTDVRKRIAEGR